MHHRKFSTTHVSLGLALLSLALHGSVCQSHAQIITLHHNNSTALIDTGSQAGMFHWDVQGQNQLHQKWFWYRIGNLGPEMSIDTISLPANSTFLGTRGLSTIYANANFNLEIDYTLTGGATVAVGQTAQADISESITINNTSGSPLDFHFFQYSDFDIGGPGNDTVQLGTDANGKFNSADQSDPLAGLTESVSVTAPSANHGETAAIPLTLNKLNNPAPDTLNDNPVAGPGNVTWALEWDLSIDPGGSVLISKDKHLTVQIVPEPSALVLLPAALLASAFYRRARRK